MPNKLDSNPTVLSDRMSRTYLIEMFDVGTSHLSRFRTNELSDFTPKINKEENKVVIPWYGYMHIM